MFYGIIECSIDCPRCENPILLDGPLLKVHCNSCQSNVDISIDYWVYIFKSLRDEIMNGKFKDGKEKTRKYFDGTFSTMLVYGRHTPNCSECNSGFEINENMTKPYTHTCSKCGNNIDVAYVPEWLSDKIPSTYILYNALLVESEDTGISAESRVIAFTCPQCGGALMIDGKNRILPCQFCGVEVYLPDDLWLRLHPTKTKRRWGIGYQYPSKKLSSADSDPAFAISTIDNESLGLSGKAWLFSGLHPNSVRGIDSGKHPKGKIAWRIKLGETEWLNSMALVNNKLYIPSDDPYDGEYSGLWCVDATTGKILWRYDTTADADNVKEAGCLSGVVVWDNKCYFQSKNSYLYCISADTGELIHKMKLDTNFDIDSVPTIANGRLYVNFPGGDGYLLCLSATTLEEIYRIECQPHDTASPIIKDNKMYFSGYNEILCVDEISAITIWRIVTDEEIDTQIVLSDNFLYYADDYYGVVCHDINNGKVVWKFRDGEYGRSSPIVVDNRIYFGSQNHTFYCLDATTGEIIWTYICKGRIYSSPALADGRVYFGDSSDRGRLYCADAISGKVYWKRKLKEYGEIEAPIIAVDGRIYYHSSSGMVYCLE